MKKVPEHDVGNDPLGELAEALARDPEVWKWDEDPTVFGRVLEVGDVETQYGIAPTLTLLSNDGRELIVYGYSTVLRRGIAERAIEPGDLWGARYLGEQVPASGGKPYRNFKVVHRRGDGSPVQRRSEASSQTELPPDQPVFDDEPPPEETL